MNIRWRRWIAGAAGLLAAYGLVGFWLVPLVVKHQVPKFGQAELGRQASIGEFSFNPYTLRLEARDVRLAEADGAPLFSIGKLSVELEWRSLLRRAWSFAEITIGAPSVRLAIAPDGTFNISQLLATFKHAPESTDSAMPRLIIGRFALEQGKVELRDRHAGYASDFAPINFALTDFSTLPKQNGKHTFSADLARGGKLRWRGDASLNPMRGSGELTLQNAALPELAAYLKPYTRARIAAGRLDVTLPYRFSVDGGTFEASLAGAGLALRDLALERAGAGSTFATLTRLAVTGVSADLARRAATVAEVRVDGASLNVKRAASGELDLAQLMATGEKPAQASQLAPPRQQAPAGNDWKLDVKAVALQGISINAVDETVSPPLKVSADKLALRLRLNAGQSGAKLLLTGADAAFSLADLTLASGSQTPFKLGQLGFTDGAFDLDAKHASVGRLYAENGQLQLVRDGKGQLNILSMLPGSGATGQAAPAPDASGGPAAAAGAPVASAKMLAVSGARSAPSVGAPWVAVAKRVELTKFSAQIEDQDSGVKVNVQDLAVNLEGAGSDLTRPVKFDVGMSLREGGRLSARGNVVPASGASETDVQVTQLALAPLQPVLGQHLKLKIAGGSVSTQGRLITAARGTPAPDVRYAGGFDIADLLLNEEDGKRFAAWKSVRADKLTASVAPNLLDIPLLRVIEPHAILMIENDRSLNAARLLVQPAASPAVPVKPAAVAAPTPAKTVQPALARDAQQAPAKDARQASTASDPFPVRIARLRFENAKLDFTDLSLRPQFGAKIYELNGVINRLASNRESRSHIELDGRVNEFGLARIRGNLNPFAPRDNTDINVVFKNIDMVSTSPYAMKFAGYTIAEGKISLDLQYKVRDSQLEGANQIVIDKLTLGERIDSPDALNLPLALAIAILKDGDGRIDLGLPISGDMSDPKFSYGALLWKTIGNVLGKIVSAPFRALGGLLGGDGAKLESIDFDPGSDVLLPPEREKLIHLARMLSARGQLTLSVPGQYSEAADGAVLKTRALRLDVARRAGVKLGAGELPGPLDVRDPAVRGALRALYTERFGAAEFERRKQAAEAAPVSATTGGADGRGGAGPQADAARQKLALWRRIGNLVQGEPQVADARLFYRMLEDHLSQNQPLDADGLTRLGASRAGAIRAALREAGVEPARMLAATPGDVSAEAGKPVSIKLGLTAR